MPLRVLDTTDRPESLKKEDVEYLIFYSSITNGTLWCPDCVNVEDLVKKTFSASDAPSAGIIYVGQRPEWKTPANVFRGAPYKITSVPTIIRIRDGEEVGRLVDDEISSKLAAFIKE